jgi:hypothetical protein
MMRANDTNFGRPITIPQRRLMEREGIGINVLNRLLRAGEVVSCVVGKRHRHIFEESYAAYVARQLSGTTLDPAERAKNIERYRSSIMTYGFEAAARARAGRPRSNRETKRGKTPPASAKTRRRKISVNSREDNTVHT